MDEKERSKHYYNGLKDIKCLNMTKNRMTGKDYRKELEDIEARKKSLRAHVLERLKFLIKLYPNAQFHDNDKGITASMLNDSFIEAISTTVKIRFIENIEKWSEEQQGVQQLKI